MSIGIIGAGRAGASLAVALQHANYDVFVHSRERKTLPASFALTSGNRIPWLGKVDVVILAVPDAKIPDLADRLAATAQLNERQVVLHLSGALDEEALTALGSSGAALGSFHPFQTLTDAAWGPERLRGALAAVQGMPRAVTVAMQIAESLGMHPIRIDADQKARYHAAAVFSANYPIVIAHLAERLLQDAGVEWPDARRAVVRIMQGTVANLTEQGSVAGLTGPVSRGDAETVARHLDALPDDIVEVYRSLARVAMDVAGLEGDVRERMERVLE